MSARVAIVDDQPRMREVIAMVLRRAGYEVETFDGGAALLGSELPDLVLTDLRMPGMTGVELLAAIRERDPRIPVILITAHASVRAAVDAMQNGAFDYLEKPVDNTACTLAVERALAHTRLSRENRYLRAQLASRYDLDRAIAVSDSMRQVFALSRRAARSTATVLISGESGTGKELVARSIHLHSPRVGGPFEAVNCKALAAGVLESELFGHEKGSFTGADRARPGLFERASGGTVFLDEIGEIDADFQGKLLRVLQEKQVVRVGGQGSRAVDVRVVAATNRDLKAEVDAGRFRSDLFFRLNVVPIQLPPLRERPDDIVPLARHFLERHGEAQGRAMEGWSAEVEAWLLQHDWPGNVRELENTIERGVVLALTETIELGDLLLAQGRDPHGGTLNEVMEAAADARIREVLAQVGGRRQDAARILGIERTTLYRLMKKYGVD